MLAHLIHFKGKGFWVLSVPLICGIVLFVFCDATNVGTKYVRPACFIISAIVLWFVDKGDDLIRYGRNTNRGLNTVMWIDVKFWAIALALAGFISLLYL